MESTSLFSNYSREEKKSKARRIEPKRNEKTRNEHFSSSQRREDGV
jgi:hypothetical protein